MIAQDYLRVHAVKLGIIAKDCPRLGFHNFRHYAEFRTMPNSA